MLSRSQYCRVVDAQVYRPCERSTSFSSQAEKRGVVADMLRVHLDPAHLAKVHFSTDPAPLDEIMVSLRLLRSGPEHGAWGQWRRRTRERLPKAALPLLDLVRHNGCAPALPGTLAPDLDAALDLVASAPATALGSELAATYPNQRMPLWVRDLARADRDAIGLLTGGLRAYYRNCLEPDLHQVRATLRADVARRARLLRHDPDRLLGTLSPGMRWRPPYLELDRGADSTLFPDERGLLLMPSAYCTQPLVGALPDGTVAIAYPVPPESDSLAALLGTTRAGVLLALVDDSHTTTELAVRLGISPATTSEHTAVLRRAGLITTMREGQSVRHSLTALGGQLLEANAPAER
jgi:DNA-binding transcriptional ArsR family regulator